MDIKDIESGASHIANEVLLLLCNDRKWHDSWVDYVAFIKTSDFYDVMAGCHGLHESERGRRHVGVVFIQWR